MHAIYTKGYAGPKNSVRQVVLRVSWCCTQVREQVRTIARASNRSKTPVFTPTGSTRKPLLTVSSLPVEMRNEKAFGGSK